MWLWAMPIWERPRTPPDRRASSRGDAAGPTQRARPESDGLAADHVNTGNDHWRAVPLRSGPPWIVLGRRVCQRRRCAAVWMGEGVGACAVKEVGGNVEKPKKERRGAKQCQAGLSKGVPGSTIKTSVSPEQSVSCPSRGQHVHPRTCKKRGRARRAHCSTAASAHTHPHPPPEHMHAIARRASRGRRHPWQASLPHAKGPYPAHHRVPPHAGPPIACPRRLASSVGGDVMTAAAAPCPPPPPRQRPPGTAGRPLPPRRPAVGWPPTARGTPTTTA